MTSDQIQEKINANAAEQQAVLAGTSPDKLPRLRALQEQQSKLYRQRDAAKRDEQGRGPRERVGI